MKRIAFWPIWLFMMLVIVGCSGPTEPTATPVPPTPTPTPQDWLNGAVGAWNNTQSFHFTLNLANRTIPLTPGVAAAQAEGDVVAPDRVQIATLVQTLIGSTRVQFVGIGEQQWLTNPLNGRWEVAPPELQTDVTGIFDSEVGIGALLADLQNLERLPDERQGDTPTVHLRGTLPGTALVAFAPDLGDEEVTVDLWMAVGDQRIRNIVITEPANAEGETPTWTFLFSNFDADLSIEPPL